MTDTTRLVDADRVDTRRDAEPSGEFVLYWMQQAQRAEDNEALEYAVQQANRLHIPLAVVFCVVPDYPDASARHFTFMFEGLAETAGALERRGIAFEALVGEPAAVIGALGHRVALLVTDAGFLPIQRRWRAEVLDAYPGPVHEVTTDAVVPPHLVSDDMEYAARTIRPRITRHLERFTVGLRTTALDRPSVTGSADALSLTGTARNHRRVDLTDVGSALRDIGATTGPPPVSWLHGGTSSAKARLRSFVGSCLPEYSSRRNSYDHDDTSSVLSPYLHYGQISPVYVAHTVRSSGAPAAEVDAFVEELVVRRELAINYALHGDAIDTFSSLPDWARETLEAHRDDERPGVVTAAGLEQGETGDEVWNTIMDVIRRDGWVHNQLRMYWGKQILYWTNTPEHAFRTLLDLNNRWFLDGRDPNSYANVAWCFGRHDQGFQERPVIGKIRPFTTAALRRKGDLDGWMERARG